MSGKIADFDVRFLGTPYQDVECAFGGDVVGHHQHAFGLFDLRAGGGDLGQDGLTLVRTMIERGGSA